MTAELEGGEWSAAHPGRTLPPGRTRYPFYRRLGGPQGRSGRAENLVPTGIWSRTFKPVVCRYTDWATRPTHTHTHTHTHTYIYIYMLSDCPNIVWDVKKVCVNITTHTCSPVFLNKSRCVMWAEICRSECRKRRERCVTCSWPLLSTNLISQHIGLYSDKMLQPTKDTHLWLWWLDMSHVGGKWEKRLTFWRNGLRR